MDERVKQILIDALDTHESSLKRAINTSKKPVFTEVYKTDLASIAYAREFISAATAKK